MLSMEDFITAVFCCVDDLLKEVINGQPIRSRGFQPSLSDSEVITMEIVAEFQGIDTDKGIWQYFRRHWMSMFPQMKSRSTFVRQAAFLMAVQAKATTTLGKGTWRSEVIIRTLLMEFRFRYVALPVFVVVVAFKGKPAMVTALQKRKHITDFMVTYSLVPVE